MRKYQLYDNKDLLGLLSNNDEIAFTELYDRFWQKLFAIAYCRLKEIETAEDIVHDVFASLWANRQEITIESLDNYLATAVKYMVLDKIKKKERERLYKNAFDQPQVVESSDRGGVVGGDRITGDDELGIRGRLCRLAACAD